MEKQKLSEIAYLQIKKLIQTGKYHAGMALPEKELSEMLHMSRTPIREALFRLKEDMVVTITSHFGAVVSSLDFKQLCDLYETREAIEGMVVNLISRPNVPVKDFEDLLAEYARIKDIYDDTIRYEEYYKTNERFKEVLGELCGNAMLAKYYYSIQDKVKALNCVSHLIPIYPDIGVQERIAVLEAIVRKDAVGAEKMARYRVRCCLKRILDSRLFGNYRYDQKTPSRNSEAGNIE